jgi:hypothetical protein
MSAESRLTGPDFSNGVPLTEIADGGMLFGHAAGEVDIARPHRPGSVRGRRRVHALTWPAGGGAAHRGHSALPVAPRLFQPAHRRGAARAGARPGRLLAGRAAERDNLCP